MIGEIYLAYVLLFVGVSLLANVPADINVWSRWALNLLGSGCLMAFVIVIR